MEESASTHPAMTDDSDRSPVEELAEQFLEQFRAGKRPSITSYAQAHPDHAAEIQELFPTLIMLEQCSSGDARESSVPIPQRLLPEIRRLGDYRILREIGRGGMGVVYEAEHIAMQRRVALKVLQSSLSSRPVDLQRFLRETRVVARLHHTNIVPIFEVGQDAGCHFYAMQFIRGENLADVITALAQCDGVAAGSRAEDRLATDDSIATTLVRSLVTDRWQTEAMDGQPEAQLDAAEAITEVRTAESTRVESRQRLVTPADEANPADLFQADGWMSSSYFARVARIGLQAADALDYAHGHGVLHRDIKPSNLLLDTEGVVWISDFGLAKHEDDDLTRTEDLVGTLRYLAPERFDGRVDAGSDIYGLGLTLYELCTLKPAFEATDRASLTRQVAAGKVEPPRQRNRRIPRDLETIILKAIAVDPGARYRSAEAMAEDLRRFLADRPITARRASALEITWRWCRRNPVLASLWACIIGLLLVLMAGLFRYSYKTRQHSIDLAAENQRANQARQEAVEANRIARRRLYESYIDRAQAGRWSGRPGQHFRSLQAITQAASLLEELETKPAELQRQKLLLRNEAIAAMPLADLEPIREWDVTGDWTATVAFDPDYRWYAQSDLDGRILVRGVEQSQLVADLPATGHRAWVLRFSPDGRYLAGKYHDGPPRPTAPIVRVWDLRTGKDIIAIDRGLNMAAFAFSPDSKRFAIESMNGTVRLYGLPDGKVVRTRRFSGPIPSLCFSPQSEELAVAVEKESAIQFWNVDANRLRELPATFAVTVIDWSRNGRQFAAGSNLGELSLWDARNWDAAPRKLPGHAGRVTRLQFSGDGERLASMAWDSSLRFWNVPTGQQELRIDGMLLSHTPFRGDGQVLGLSGPGNRFGLWRIANNSPLHYLRNGVAELEQWTVTFHPHDPSLLVTGTGAGVEVWDAQRRRLLNATGMGKVRSVCFADRGETLITSGDRGVIEWECRIENKPNGRTVALKKKKQLLTGRGIERCDLSSDGTRLIVRTGPQTATIIDRKNSKPPILLEGHRQLDRVKFSPDGRWAVTCTWHGTGVRIWETQTGRCVQDLSPDIGSATVSFSPDGRWLAATTGEQQILWQVGDWKTRWTIDRIHPDGWPGPIRFSPDARLLAMPLKRDIVQLVDPATATQQAVLESPTSASLGSHAFSPDGRYLAITQLGMIQLWDLREVRRRLARMGLDWKSAGESEHQSN